LMHGDKHKQEQLEIYQEELEKLTKADLDKIFSGDEKEQRAKLDQLIALTKSTQEMQNFSGKEQKIAVKDRQKLILDATNSNALNEFITHQICEEMKNIKIGLAENDQIVTLTPQQEQQIIAQAALKVEQGMNALLAEAVGKKVSDQNLGRELFKSFISGAVAGAGPLFIALQQVEGTFKEEVIKHSREKTVMETVEQIESKISLASKSDGELKSMLDETDAAIKEMSFASEDKNQKEIEALRARKDQIGQVLNFGLGEFKGIINDARAQALLMPSNVDRGRIEREIAELEKSLILKMQLGELKAGNDQKINNLVENIVLKPQEERKKANELEIKEKKLTSWLGLLKRFGGITGEEKRAILKKTGWEGAKGLFFGAIGAELFHTGGAACSGKGVHLGESAGRIVDQATFGLSGKMVAELRSRGVAEAASLNRADQKILKKSPEEIAQEALKLGTKSSKAAPSAPKQEPAQQPQAPKTEASPKSVPQTPTQPKAVVPETAPASSINKGAPAEALKITAQKEVFAKKGDSLWKIADSIRSSLETEGKITRQNYSAKGAEAAKWAEAETTRINNEITKALSEGLKNPDLIKPNQKISIPQESKILERLQKKGIIDAQHKGVELTETKVKNIIKNNEAIRTLVEQVKQRNKTAEPSKKIHVTTQEMINKATEGKQAGKIIQEEIAKNKGAVKKEKIARREDGAKKVKAGEEAVASKENYSDKLSSFAKNNFGSEAHTRNYPNAARGNYTEMFDNSQAGKPLEIKTSSMAGKPKGKMEAKESKESLEQTQIPKQEIKAKEKNKYEAEIGKENLKYIKDANGKLLSEQENVVKYLTRYGYVVGRGGINAEKMGHCLKLAGENKGLSEGERQTMAKFILRPSAMNAMLFVKKSGFQYPENIDEFKMIQKGDSVEISGVYPRKIYFDLKRGKFFKKTLFSRKFFDTAQEYQEYLEEYFSGRY
ncbi:MAG: LysM peptidoglycan-binding domain-containing protein, partial [bacterium]